MFNTFVTWTIIAFIFMMFEMGAPGLFFFLSFASAAFVTACISLIYVEPVVQGATFIASTVLSLAVLRYCVKRGEHKKNPTNVYALQGKSARVISAVRSNMPGQVNIAGEVWSARSVHGQEINVDQIVRILYVRGAHVIVEKMERSVD